MDNFRYWFTNVCLFLEKYWFFTHSIVKNYVMLNKLKKLLQ